MLKRDGTREDRYELVGEGNAHAMEALRLEIARLAKRHGVSIKELRIEAVPELEGPST